MLIGRAALPDDQELLCVGLTEANVKYLRTGQYFLQSLEVFGCPDQVLLICLGDSDENIKQELSVCVDKLQSGETAIETWDTTI